MKLHPTIIIILTILTSVLAESEDVYNSAKLSSDLNWKAPTNDNEWSEQSARGRDGNVVRTLEICNSEGYSNEEHWLRSPYIYARSANRLYLEIDFSITKCQSCRETFTLYHYVANSDEATSTFPPWREGLYQKIDTLAAHKQYDGQSGSDAVERKTYSIGLENRKGIYLAIHTEGPSCMSVLKVRLYYHYCPHVSPELTEFPRTVAGKEPASLVAVEGKCATNSVPQNDDHLRFYCTAEGFWKIFTGGCACNRGYSFADGGCRACPVHTHKSTTGNGSCVDCPAHSTALEMGTSSCECDSDFYRADDDPADRDCSKIPSEPVNLHYKLTRSGVQIVWNPPRENGGRTDVYYSLTCLVCDESYYECEKCPDTVQFFPKNYNKIEATDVLLSDLGQVSFYKIKINSYNGVSEKSGKTANYAETQFSTSETVPSAVKDVICGDQTPNSLSLYWSEPERHNAVILDYEVQLQPLTPDGQLSGDDPAFTLTILRNNSKILGLKPGTRYSVRMRARTSVGHGLYSASKVFETSPAEAGEEKGAGVIIAVVAVVVMVAVIAAAAFFLMRRRTRKLQQRQKVNVANKLNELNGRRLTPASSRTAAGKTYVDYRDPHKGVKEIANEIELSKIKIHSVIGQGEFGEVWKGALVESKKKKPLDVAVKRLKDGASIVDQTNFLREACTMAQFHDPNIVELKGVVTKNMPAMIVTEYMDNGSLDKYLQKRKGELSVIDLLKMQRGIASGMKYLANMKYVHRDLAARNILIDSKHCCKVSDFGLSRTLENDPNATYTTQGGKIALRWTAPECIRYRKFTSASDVWSYGIVMWEVMSYGEKPYWDMNNDDVTDVIEDGYRLPCPGDCPCILHEMMLKCWSYDPRKRPDFAEIYTQLSSYVSKPNLLKSTAENSCVMSSSDPSTCDSTQPLLNPDSPTSIQDVSTLEEWLDMVRLGKYRRSFYAHGINDLEALSNISTSDLERLGIATPEHRTRLQSGIDTLRRHFNHQRFSLPPTDDSVSIAISDQAVHNPINIQHQQQKQQQQQQQVATAVAGHHPISAVPMLRQQQSRPGSFRTHRCDPSIAIV